MSKVFKVGLIGCGHIAETYFKAHKYFNNFKIIKCADINHLAAKKCASFYKIEALSVKNLLRDKEIEIILNLTVPKAHYEVSKKALLHNKHVYTEKPMAINIKDGKKLLQIAKRKKLYIGNAPDTFLGGGNQKSKELLESKFIGKINLGNIIFAYPGVQSYHPNPEPWFAKKEGGPVIDMGPYYLTALVNLLGPAKQVWGSLMWNKKNRIIGIGPRKGKSIRVLCPTTYLGTIFFKNKTIIRFTLSFDVIAHHRNHIELYGDKGSILVPDPNMFGGSVYTCKKLGGTWKEHKTNRMPLGKINIREKSLRANEAPINANYRGVGLAEMAYCIKKKKKHRCNGELSFHVLDIIQSIMRAAKKKERINIKSTCKIPKKFTLSEIKKILK
jgi:predicted dehydrogenase|tara:strand:- start:89 stop:1246 length:1158 start_codon:yes stop_codon:yes gene_type:complete